MDMRGGRQKNISILRGPELFTTTLLHIARRYRITPLRAQSRSIGGLSMGEKKSCFFFPFLIYSLVDAVNTAKNQTNRVKAFEKKDILTFELYTTPSIRYKFRFLYFR